MSKKEKNAAFICIECSKQVHPLNNGSYRNHCPFCLASLHVDHQPGDREHSCHGVMLPIELVYNSKKGWQVVHECQKCGDKKVNKIADACSQSDNWDLLIKLSKLIE